MNMPVNLSVIKTWFSVWGLGVCGGAELLALPPAVCPLRVASNFLQGRKRELENQKTENVQA